MTSQPRPKPGHSRFARIAWILIDWAASAFSTVLITLVVASVEKVVSAREASSCWPWHRTKPRTGCLQEVAGSGGSRNGPVHQPPETPRGGRLCRLLPLTATRCQSG